ncbi:hypothetical protein [Desulfovibrio litoralis]|uniref:Uncharacterized protein n=1 Tax=Desulfovibrio litoralis DSM 11393 TaxID=1121455 RepID=A0A1M7T8W5_9BACT|nr:hypothetical protein [Desulfovibrio litoralis]SHN67169.1 hypothetical protein SAMN02745728_01742 [Desulfovibrio litoralis DSM 11393]
MTQTPDDNNGTPSGNRTFITALEGFYEAIKKIKREKNNPKSKLAIVDSVYSVISEYIVFYFGTSDWSLISLVENAINNKSSLLDDDLIFSSDELKIIVDNIQNATSSINSCFDNHPYIKNILAHLELLIKSKELFRTLVPLWSMLKNQHIQDYQVNGKEIKVLYPWIMSGDFSLFNINTELSDFEKATSNLEKQRQSIKFFLDKILSQDNLTLEEQNTLNSLLYLYGKELQIFKMEQQVKGFETRISKAINTGEEKVSKVINTAEKRVINIVYASNFDELAEKFDVPNKWWLRTAVVLFLMTIVILFTIISPNISIVDYIKKALDGIAPGLNSPSVPKDSFDIFSFLIFIAPRMLFFFLLISAMLWCGKMYKVGRNIQENYYRLATALANCIEIMKNIDDKSDLRQNLILKMTDSMLQLPDNGYINSKNSNDILAIQQEMLKTMATMASMASSLKSTINPTK